MSVPIAIELFEDRAGRENIGLKSCASLKLLFESHQQFQPNPINMGFPMNSCFAGIAVCGLFLTYFVPFEWERRNLDR
jgi:hypothetical protein